MDVLVGGHGEGAGYEEEVEVLCWSGGERVSADFVDAVVVVAEDRVVEGLREGVAR